jgi:hypothetical protein
MSLIDGGGRPQDGLLAGYAADPTLRPHMECWSAILQGVDTEAEVLDERSVLQPVYVYLCQWVRNQGHRSTEKRYPGGWCITCACDDTQLRYLSDVVFSTFRAKIDEGVFTFRVVFSGWLFKGLRDYRDAMNYLRVQHMV